MKKIIFLISAFLLLFSNNSSAWEATFDAGYYGRLFNQRDQLGATSSKENTRFNFSSGLALNGNYLFGAKSFSFGPELTLNYGWTDTSSLQTQAAALSLLSQYSYGSLNFGFKTGVTTNILTEDYMNKIDADTGLIFGFKASADIFEGQRFFFEPQLYLSPSTTSEWSLVPSYALVIGLQKVVKPRVVVKTTVVSIVLPREVTPVKLPESATTTIEPVIKLEPIVVKQKTPEPVVLPEPSTPTQVEKPKPLILKFDGNNLSPESNGFLENVLKIHNNSPSIIKIHYSNGKNAKKKSEILYNWFVEHGAKKEETQTVSGLKGKEIKLEVAPK